MAERKTVSVEYDGKTYDGSELQRLLKEVPEPLHANIIVEYEGGDRLRPFRFSSSEVSFSKDGTARLY